MLKKSANSSLSMALLGGPESGKSTLFQAMVHRVTVRRRAGALASFIGPGPARVRRLEVGGLSAGSHVGADETEKIAGAYEQWQSLDGPHTLPADRYRLELPYRTGWLGRSMARLELDLCHRTPLPPPELDGLRQTRVLIFVVPFWACLPRADLNENDQRAAGEHLEDLCRHIEAGTEVRRESRRAASKMLLMTMADDPRGAQPRLREAWIHRVLDGHRRHLERLRRQRHLLAYLDNARRVSAHLCRVLANGPRSAARVLDLLEFEDVDKVWLLPVSALDGRVAAHVAAGGESPAASPVSAHVELPLLLALCEHAEALL